MPLTLGCIRKFPRNFLMHSLFSCIWRICELPILDLSSQGGCIRKFPGNFLMHPGSSDPGSIREFPGNFLMRPRIKFKLFGRAANYTKHSNQGSNQLIWYHFGEFRWGAMCFMVLFLWSSQLKLQKVRFQAESSHRKKCQTRYFTCLNVGSVQNPWSFDF